ncbi:MAG: hypothetical protein AAGF27_12050, partial [Pseudomonadota bacterium]
MSLWPGFVVGIFTVPIAIFVFLIWFAVQGFVVPWLVFVPVFGGILTLCASLLVAVFALTIIWVQAARYAVALCRLQMLSRQPSFWSATKASALVLVILQILFWIAGFGLDYTENSVRGATVLVGNVNVDENQIPWSAIWERFRTFLRSAAVAIMALATVPLVATVKETSDPHHDWLLFLVRICAGSVFVFVLSAVFGLVADIAPPIPVVVVEAFPISILVIVLGLVFYFAMGFNLAFEANLLK